MAIQRYKATENLQFAEVNGVKVGVRGVTVQEMLEITRQRQKFLESVNADVKADGTTGEGDTGLYLLLQEHVSKTVAVDPEDASNPWFAKDEAEQAQLAKNGVFKDLTSDVPYSFHSKIWDVFSNPLVQSVQGEVSEDAPLSPTIPAATSNELTPSSSESQSTSDATLLSSSNGVGSDSLSASSV